MTKAIMEYLAQAIDFDKFNKALFGTPAPGQSPSPFADITKPGMLGLIISRFMKYLFPFAGLLLLLYLIIGGFGYLTSAGDPKKTESAQHQITNALIGFLILFLSFWIVEIFQFMFNIEILK